MVRYKPKKTVVVPPFLKNVIQPIIQATTVADLTEALQKFDAPNHFEKPEERSLLNWYEILNKFDELLETYIKQHDILKHLPKAIPNGNPYESGATSIIGSSRSGNPTIALPSGGRIRLHDPLRLATSRFESLVRRNSDRQSSQGSGSPKKEELVPSCSIPEPLTNELIILVLKATFRVVRNASHDTKNVYNSFDHILTLLAEPDTSISMLSLEILQSLLMRSPKNRSYRPIHSNGVTDRLRDIALGWGGREKGLGLVDCCSSLKDKALPDGGHSLLLEFKNKSKSEKDSSNSSMKIDTAAGSSSSKTRKSGNTPNVTFTVVGDVSRIHVLDVRELPKGEEWLVKEFCSKYKVPRNKTFSLLLAYRRAKSFGDGRSARLNIVCQQLTALTTLAQLYPHPKALAEIFEKETDLISDIVTIAKADESYGLNDLPKSLRTLAVRCLAAMTVERSRMSQLSSAAGIGTHHGVFASLLRAEISTLLASTDSSKSAERVKMDIDTSIHVPAVSVISSDVDSEDATDIRMAEALLSLVLNISLHGGSTACSGLVASGVLGIIVPLLRDRVPSHSRAVSQAIRSINEIIQLTHSTVGSQAFRDHDGLNILAERIATETLGDLDIAKKMTEKEREAEDEQVEREALKIRGESRQMYQDLLEQPMTVERALAHQAPSSSAASRGLLPHSKWTLLRVLHALFLHALGSGGNQVRELVSSSALPLAIRHVLARPFHYGGGLFSSATTAATTIAHSEPIAVGDLVKAGIAKAMVRSIAVGLPPHGEALKVIPTALAAMCLATDARQEIVKASPIRPYVLRLATPFYSRALHGEAPSNIGGSLDEMCRHVEALRELGNAAVIEHLQASAKFVELDISALREVAKPNEITTSASKSQNLNGSARKLSSTDSTTEKSKGEKNTSSDTTPPDYVLMERMKLSVAHNAASMVGFAQGSNEHQRSIVTGDGIQEMFKLRTAAALASSKAYTKDSHPSSRSSPSPSKAIQSLATSLRAFLSRHDIAVFSATFNAVREDVSNVLRLASKLGDAWLPEEEGVKNGPDSNAASGSSKRASGPKQGSSRKRSRSQAAQSDAPVTRSSSKKAIDAATRSVSKKSTKQANDINSIRAELKDALCVLRIDVVLLSQLSRGGSSSSTAACAAAWVSQDGCSVVSLIASVERLVRYHLAMVYSGLSCNSSNESDLCTASVTAAKLPSMAPLSANKIMDGVQQIANRAGIGNVKSSDVTTACKAYHVLPEKDSNPLVEVKGLAWAMETFAYASQKLYMAMGRGLVFSSRRANRDSSRYATAIRGLAATIGNVFVSHLKAADPLWSKNVITIEEGNICAAWDYVRRIIVEIRSTLFCESNRNTQGLILRFFLSAGGAEALCNACKPLALLKGSRAELSADNVLNPQTYALNKKEFENFLKSSKINSLYSAIIFGKLQKMKKKPRSGTSSAKDADADSAMKGVVLGKLAGGSTFTEKDLEEFEKQISLVSSNMLHYRKQSAIQKTAGNSWASLCSLLQLISNCPGIMNSSPSAMPRDPDSSSLSEWQAKDVQRSAQFVAMKVLMDVTKEPSELLSAFRPSGTQTSDVISVILSILRTSSELTSNSDSYSTDHRPDSEDMERHTATDEPQVQPTISPNDVQTLVDMGFSAARAREALRRTYPPGGIEYAMEWIFSHPEPEGQMDEEDSDDSSEDEEEEADVEAEAEAEHEDSSDIDIALADAVVDNIMVGDTEMTGDGENTAMPGVEAAGDDMEDIELERLDRMGDADDDMGDRELQSIDPAEAGHDIGDPGFERIDPDEGDIPDVVSDDSIKPIVSDRSIAKDEEISKEKPEEIATRFVDKDAEDLMRFALVRELDDVCASITNTKSLTKSDRSTIASMISSVVALVPSKCEKLKKGEERQRIMSRARAVALDNYKNTKKALFESLIPVAMTAVKHEVENGSSAHASFVAVEILSILQKDRCLTSKVRLQFAEVITKELEKFLGSPQSSTSGIDSVVGIRVSFVWAHYGGTRARQALKSSGVAEIAFRTLKELGSTWDSLGNSDTVDEEATKPIKQLTINDEGETRMDADSDVASQKNQLIIPHKNQVRALTCLTTCSLILDAFVRFHARDSVIEHMENSRKPKESSAMEVDASGNKEDTSPEAPEDAENEAMDVQKDSSDSVAKMDVVEEAPAPEPVDIGELTKKLKEKAETDRKKATEKVVEDLKSVVGLDSRKPPFPLPTSELLRCCTKLITSLSKYEVGDTFIGLLQLVGAITDDQEMAKQFMEEGGVELLVNLPHLENKKTKTTSTKMLRSLVRTILRHVLEDKQTLTEAMEVEIRSSLQTAPNRARQVTSTRSIVNNSAGMMNRDLECFTRALGMVARARGPGSGFDTGLEAAEHTPQPLEYWMKESKKRDNVVCVVGNLVKLLVNPSSPVKKGSSKDNVDSHGHRRGMGAFALSLLSELVQLCPVITAEFLQVASPDKKTEGSALDFVVQELLHAPDAPASSDLVVSPTIVESMHEREGLAESARNLIIALLSKTLNGYKPAVKALAEAARIESERKSARGGVVRSLSLCIIPMRKMRVLKEMIESEVANHLAKCLDHLDMSNERIAEVTSTVLKALSIIGQSAEQVSNRNRGGSGNSNNRSRGGGDNEEVLITQPRDMWTSLRDRESVSPLATGYMVL